MSYPPRSSRLVAQKAFSTFHDEPRPTECGDDNGRQISELNSSTRMLNNEFQTMKS
jgi:hypothetical protein